MSNLNPEFREFFQKITPSASQRKMVRELRHSLRTRIRRYFQNKLKRRPPAFIGRGRVATRTLLSPLNGEIHLEDGILLQDLDKDDLTSWPDAEIIHMQMIEAVHGQTPDPPAVQKYSICVRYPGLYRIELFILAQNQGGWRLAVNGSRGWYPDDQQQAAVWFEKQIQRQGQQLRRMACYLNAWADFPQHQLQGLACRLPLDILAGQHFRADIGRDDRALAMTTAAIAAAVPVDFKWPSPTGGGEALTWLLSSQQNQDFRQAFEELAEKTALAVKVKNKEQACAIWRSLLGDRFPMGGRYSRWQNRGFPAL